LKIEFLYKINIASNKFNNMKLCSKSVLFLFALFTTQWINAQNISQNDLKGQFLDEKKASFPFVNVLLLKAQDSSLFKGAITNTEGHFSFDKIPSGKYILSARMVGYTNYFSEPFELLGKGKEFEPIVLQIASQELQEVSVSASKSMIEIKNNAIVLNVESSPILNNGSALEALSKAPGITVDQDGNINLKGKQNVSVMIDDKLTYLSTEQVSQLLENTPAENIETIEIIENPSAKYDAAGNSGIINIRMKRDKNLGMNGNLSLRTGYGKYEKMGGGIRLNYRSKKFATSVDYSTHYRKRYQLLTLNRRIPYKNDFTLFNQTADYPRSDINHRFQITTDWYLGEKTTLGLMVNGNIGDWDGTNDGKTNLRGLNPNIYNTLYSTVDNLMDWKNISGNLHLNQQIGKGKLSVDFDYSRWNRNGDQTNLNEFFADNQEVENPYSVKTLTDTKIDIYATKVDYSITLDDKSKLEIGAKSSSVKTDNTLKTNTKEGDRNWAIDPTRSNQFEYTEEIHAGYINLSRQFGKLSLQGGLRAEYTISDGYSETLDKRNKREYFNFFPSLSMSYKPSKNHSFSFSYSRRVDRPNYDHLNPFIFYLDQYTFQKGNPFLNPQFTNSFSGTYTFQEASMIQVSYSKTTDAIMDIFEQDNENQTTLVTNDNLSKFENMSITFSTPLPIRKWWMMNLNLTGFNNQIRSPFSDGNQIDKTQWSYNLNVTNNFDLPLKTKMEVSFAYRSPTVWALFEIKPMYSTDLGLSKSFGKLKARFSVSDIFNTRQFATKIRQGDIHSDIKNKWETRVMHLNLSYNFGNKNVKTSKRRKTASEELQNRANQHN